MNILQSPTMDPEFLIKFAEVSSYIPGRIRLRSKKIVGNPKLAQRIYGELKAFQEIQSVEISVLTGSLLILYEPEILRTNPKLAKMEDYIRVKAGRK
ncbi:MAG: hypothetical protein IKN12_11600 [Selenomonadaceae bacterium]|nr:hypothetical protein [Selenomonadaceae bacterium]